MSSMDGNHKTVGTFVSFFNQSRKITSMLGKHISSTLRIPLAAYFETTSIMQQVYVVLVMVHCFTELVHASTPEFKRGGVYLSGDVILGGLFPVHKPSSDKGIDCSNTVYTRGIQRLEAMLYAVDEINKDPTLLRGIKIGVNILDTCGRDTYALNQSLEFIRDSLNHFDVNQYECTIDGKPSLGTPRLKFNTTGPILGVVGASYSTVSIQVANLLRLFRIPQISPASTAKMLSDKTRFEMFARTVPPDTFQAIALVDIVKSFNWTYISTVYSAGSYGEQGIDVFNQEADKRDICIATQLKVPGGASNDTYREIVRNLMKAVQKTNGNAKAVVLFVKNEDARGILKAAQIEFANRTTTNLGDPDRTFYWLASDGWGKQKGVVRQIEEFAVGAITVELESKIITGFDDYMKTLTPEDNERNLWFRDYWEDVFECDVDQTSGTRRRWKGNRGGKRFARTKNRDLCDPGFRLSQLANYEQDSKIQFVIDAVYSFAIALDALKATVCPTWKGVCPAMSSYDGGEFYKKYLLAVDFKDVANSTVRFDEKGDGLARYTIYNYQKDEDSNTTDYKVIGRWFSEWEPRLQLNVSKIVWSAKDQAKVIEAKKKKHSMHMSSSYIAESEYAQNYNKESAITIKGEDKIQLTNGNSLAVQDFGSFHKQVDNGMHQYRNSVREDNSQLKNIDDEEQKITFTSRIPISVCALPCKVGVKKVMSTGDSCCWHCQECQPYERLLDEFTCEDCGEGRYPIDNKTECYDLEQKHMRWDSVFAIIPVCISAVGIVITVATLGIFLKNQDTPLVRASGRELSYVILGGLLLNYLNTFILLARPSMVICTLQRFTVGMGFSIVYGALLTKTNRISRIFTSASKTARRPSYISPKSQLIITSVLVAVQFIATLVWVFAAFPDAKTEFPTNDRKLVILKCNVNDSSFLISQVYNMVLICVCTFYAVKTRKVPENFNEAKFIGFTMYTTCIIWLAFIPIYFGTGNTFEVQITTLCISISLSGFVTISCMFSPKVYIIVFQPEKNVRKLTMNSAGPKKTTTSLISNAATAALASNNMPVPPSGTSSSGGTGTVTNNVTKAQVVTTTKPLSTTISAPVFSSAQTSSINCNKTTSSHFGTNNGSHNGTCDSKKGKEIAKENKNSTSGILSVSTAVDGSETQISCTPSSSHGNVTKSEVRFSSPVHRASDATNSFLASPNLQTISPGISSVSSNSTKPLTTQMASTSLTVAPSRVSHGSITFADDVGKSLTETNGGIQHNNKQVRKNTESSINPPEILHTCHQQHQSNKGNEIKEDNHITSKCLDATESQRASSSDVATSPISPHYFINSKFDPESFDTCSCSRPKKPKPAIKPYKDPINSDDNQLKESNGVSHEKEKIIKNKNLPNCKKQEHETVTQSDITSNFKKKNQMSELSAAEKINSGLNHDSLVTNTSCQSNTKYTESQTMFSPYSHTSERARLIESEVTATSDFDSSEGNCDECNPHEHQLPLASNPYHSHIKQIHHDTSHMPNTSANVVHPEGGHPLSDCYGGGSCSEECYSYSGSASGCSCMGSCDQQSQIITEDGDSIVTGATIGSSLVANCEGLPGLSTHIHGDECMARSLIDASLLNSANTSSNTLTKRKMNSSLQDANSFYHLEHDTLDHTDIDLSIILRPQKGHHHHTLPHHRPQFNNSSNKATKSMETIPLEMCQDIPDVLI